MTVRFRKWLSERWRYLLSEVELTVARRRTRNDRSKNGFCPPGTTSSCCFRQGKRPTVAPYRIGVMKSCWTDVVGITVLRILILKSSSGNQVPEIQFRKEKERDRWQDIVQGREEEREVRVWCWSRSSGREEVRRKPKNSNSPSGEDSWFRVRLHFVKTSTPTSTPNPLL